MPSIINLSPIWEHTLTEILNHGNKTEVGIIMRSWVKHNNLEDMSDLLIYDLNDFTLGGTLCHYKETAEATETKLMPNTPLKELYNLYRYIQHLILESEFEYDDEEFENPLDEDTYFVASAPSRILCPQHLAQIAKDNYPLPLGTGEVTGDKYIQLFWNQRKYVKTIKLDPRRNIGMTHTALGIHKFQDFVDPNSLSMLLRHPHHPR